MRLTPRASLPVPPLVSKLERAKIDTKQEKKPRIDIAAGKYHSLLLLDGALFSCGSNEGGVLGLKASS